MNSRAWVLAIALTVVVAAPVLARSRVWSTFSELYKPKDGGAIATARCMVCHVTTGDYSRLNPYGADLKPQWEKSETDAAFKAIEKADSDKDGFDNITEIRTDTLPGDPNSKPRK